MTKKTTTRRHPLALAAVAAVTFLTTMTGVAAHAGEISLFENPNFQGRQISLRGPAASVSNVGFNDRTASIVVRSGRWEVCSDDNFRGECAIFEPGQYATLDRRFSRQVSSAREIETIVPGAPPVVISASSLELFGQPNFRGRSTRLDNDVRNFNVIKFNDRTGSLIVQGSTWELCTDANFRGNCRTFAPGQYPTLGYGMSKSISSARPVLNQPAPPVMRGGGRDDHDGREHDRRDGFAGRGDGRDDRDHQRPNGDTGRGDIELFSGVNFSGERYPLGQNMTNFRDGGFNDSIGSIIVNAGQWELCVDADFRGGCTVFGPGRYASLGNLNRQLSSMRRIE